MPDAKIPPQPPKAAPMGIEPRGVWTAKRRQALLEAIARYTDAGLAVPDAWIEELAWHVKYPETNA